MCDCIYYRQEPYYPREQANKAIERKLNVAWERGYAKGNKEARYQIERAIAQLEETHALDDNYTNLGRVAAVVTQLKAYLAAR